MRRVQGANTLRNVVIVKEDARRIREPGGAGPEQWSFVSKCAARRGRNGARELHIQVRHQACPRRQLRVPHPPWDRCTGGELGGRLAQELKGRVAAMLASSSCVVLVQVVKDDGGMVICGDSSGNGTKARKRIHLKHSPSTMADIKRVTSPGKVGSHRPLTIEIEE